MPNIEALNSLWQNQSQVIRGFLEIRPSYEKLADEVAYILEKSVRSADIEFAAITHRAKALDSFCEKVLRKSYKNPLNDITDIAGVRVVFLYRSDRPKIERIIRRQFDLVEVVDTIERNAPDHFGYGAIHYLVRLGKKTSGARYDELKGLICEIQVRTILQDAWAVVAQHLSYKHESDVPKELHRKLNGLSALFENADDDFNQLRDERTAYRKKVQKQLERGREFLKQELNLENFIEYLNWRFPKREVATRESVAKLLSQLTALNYKRLDQIEDGVSMALAAMEASEAKYPPTHNDTMQKCRYTSVGAVRVALTFADKQFLEYRKKEEELVTGSYEEFLNLVKRSES